MKRPCKMLGTCPSPHCRVGQRISSQLPFLFLLHLQHEDEGEGEGEAHVHQHLLQLFLPLLPLLHLQHEGEGEGEVHLPAEPEAEEEVEEDERASAMPV